MKNPAEAEFSLRRGFGDVRYLLFGAVIPAHKPNPRTTMITVASTQGKVGGNTITTPTANSKQVTRKVSLSSVIMQERKVKQQRDRGRSDQSIKLWVNVIMKHTTKLTKRRHPMTRKSKRAVFKRIFMAEISYGVGMIAYDWLDIPILH